MELVVHKHSRIDILDAIRGVAILSMVVYHGLYDVCDIFGYRLWIFDFFTILEPWFAGAFILLCGLSCRFSHSNVRRGLRVVAIAMAVTLVTVLFSVFVSPGQEIYFGILHFMGFAILVYVPLRRLLDRIRPPVALTVYTLLFLLTYAMPSSYQLGLPGLISIRLPEWLATVSQTLAGNVQAVFHINLPGWVTAVVGLYPFGLPDINFQSADYFPLIPWFFLFLVGTVIGVPVREHKLPDKFYTARVPFFACAGRNTLLIYVLHQPVIYGILLLLFAVLR